MAVKKAQEEVVSVFEEAGVLFVAVQHGMQHCKLFLDLAEAEGVVGHVLVLLADHSTHWI